MVLCLVTLTDVYTGRAGLLASYELLVEIFDCKNAVWNNPPTHRRTDGHRATAKTPLTHCVRR